MAIFVGLALVGIVGITAAVWVSLKSKASDAPVTRNSTVLFQSDISIDDLEITLEGVSLENSNLLALSSWEKITSYHVENLLSENEYFGISNIRVITNVTSSSKLNGSEKPGVQIIYSQGFRINSTLDITYGEELATYSFDELSRQKNYVALLQSIGGAFEQLTGIISMSIMTNSPSYQPTMSLFPSTVPSFSPTARYKLYWERVSDDLNVANLSEPKFVSSADGIWLAQSQTLENANRINANFVVIVKKNVTTSSYFVHQYLGGHIKSIEDHFGDSISLTGDAKKLAVGSWGWDHGSLGENFGSVNYYTRESTSDEFINHQQLIGHAANDQYGSSTLLTPDGMMLAVGALGTSFNGKKSGSVYLYTWNATSDQFVEIQRLDGEAEGDWFGASISLTSNAQMIVIGAQRTDYSGSASGSLYIYTFDEVSNEFKEKPRLDGQIENLAFGQTMDVSEKGDLLVVVTPGVIGLTMYLYANDRTGVFSSKGIIKEACPESSSNGVVIDVNDTSLTIMITVSDDGNKSVCKIVLNCDCSKEGFVCNGFESYPDLTCGS